MKNKNGILLLFALAMPIIVGYYLVYSMIFVNTILPYLTYSISGYPSIDSLVSIILVIFIMTIIKILPKDNIGWMSLCLVFFLILLVLSMRIITWFLMGF